MKGQILAVATLGVLAAFVACNRETTPGTSAATESSSRETSAQTQATATPESTTTVSSVATDVAKAAQSGAEQVAEGAKEFGSDVKDGARQATAAAGAALESGGKKLQQVADAAVRQSTEPAATQPASEAPAEGSLAKGAVIFKAKCVSCHGADASGNTAMGKKNSIPDLRSSVVQDVTDAELAAMIANGKPGGMSEKAHKNKALTEDQIKDVVAYLRSIRM